MKSDDAKRILEAARARATSMGKAVTIIVVDTAGVPVVLERVDDPPAFTAVVAEGKAAASAFTGRDSAQLQGMAENYPSLVSALSTRLGGRFLALQGGRRPHGKRRRGRRGRRLRGDRRGGRGDRSRGCGRPRRLSADEVSNRPRVMMSPPPPCAPAT